MPLFEIKSRWDGHVIFSLECGSLRICIETATWQGAVLRNVDLTGADLRNADLRGADLTGADLTGAVLRNVDLTGADLRNVVLRNADLTGAVLRGAVLRGADLKGAFLTGADLTGAILTGAVLTDVVLRNADLTDVVLTGAFLRNADLTGVVLTGADLTPIRDDFWAVLCSSPCEAAGLRKALIEGRIDGSSYTGSCACLIGTLANVQHCKHDEIPGLSPNSSRPAERFFLAIKPGDTLENSQFVKLAIEWLDQWDANMRSAFTAEVTA